MSVDLIKLLCTALENLDWNYVTLSRVQYFHGKKPPDFSSKAHWLERPFAYELYHQLRRMWATNGFESACVIHAEVYKEYQQIKNLDKMPDFLFHLPEPDRNLAVVEIKLAANRSRRQPFAVDVAVLAWHHYRQRGRTRDGSNRPVGGGKGC
jgi:hypothetical protein